MGGIADFLKRPINIYKPRASARDQTSNEKVKYTFISNVIQDKVQCFRVYSALGEKTQCL